jgi:hypothetical protein
VIAVSYANSAAIAGDGGRALGVAYTTLAGANFRVAEEGKGSAEFVGPTMLSSRQNPLNGARRVRVAVRGHTVHLEADLQGVGWLFVILGVILVMIGVVLAVVMALQKEADASPAVLILPLGIWVLLLPLMYWWTRRMVVQAYDALLVNMVAAEKRR